MKEIWGKGGRVGGIVEFESSTQKVVRRSLGCGVELWIKFMAGDTERFISILVN